MWSQLDIASPLRKAELKAIGLAEYRGLDRMRTIVEIKNRGRETLESEKIYRRNGVETLGTVHFNL